MREHTPGPWSAEHAEATNVRDQEGGIICQMKFLRGRHGMGGRRDTDEVESNARLIAAAPDLLKAFKAVLLDIDFMVEEGTIKDVRGDVIYVAARRAISRATEQGSGA